MEMTPLITALVAIALVLVIIAIIVWLIPQFSARMVAATFNVNNIGNIANLWLNAQNYQVIGEKLIQ